MPKGKQWTESELIELRKDYGVLSTKELEEKYGVNYPVIKYTCKKYRIKNIREKKWTEELTSKFVDDWQNRDIPVENMLNKYQTTYEGLRSKAQELNLNRRMIDIDEKEVIRLYVEDGLSMTMIGNKYRCSDSYISTILDKYKTIKRESRDYQKKYNVDESLFDVIDTEEKAYFLGLLYADGSNFTDRNCVQMTLQSQDDYILKRLRKLLGDENRKMLIINSKVNEKTYTQFSITNKLISKSLEKHGVVKNKTFKLKFPSTVPNELIHHFIRGYFDGDGCVSIYNRSNGSSGTYFSILSTSDFLESLSEILKRECNIKYIKIRKEKERSEVFTLSVGGSVLIERILNYLYKDANVFLTRKYEKYLELKNRNKDGWTTRRKNKTDKWANRSVSFKHNTSGYTNVYWSKQKSKWFATIRINNKTKHLGFYENKEDAIKARKDAEVSYY